MTDEIIIKICNSIMELYLFPPNNKLPCNAVQEERSQLSGFFFINLMYSLMVFDADLQMCG